MENDKAKPGMSAAKKNAREYPRIYYARHISDGVCQYGNERILIRHETLCAMDASFACKPLYTEHKENNLSTLENDAAGYVIESFYLPEDGCHWAKIIVQTDEGLDLVRQGWKVSNAYEAQAFAPGGEWHAVGYDREITKGKYLHLALTDSPRYEEAAIMTEEEFKQYRQQKKEQLESMRNSKRSGTIGNAAKTAKGEADKMGTITLLNTTKTTASPETEIEIDGERVTLSELVKLYRNSRKNKKNEVPEEDSDEENEEEETDGEEQPGNKKASKKKASKKKNKGCAKKEDEEDEEEDAENEDEPENEDGGEEENEDGCDEEDAGSNPKNRKTNARAAQEEANRKAILEAEEKANSKDSEEIVADTMSRRLARGWEKYGPRK